MRKALSTAIAFAFATSMAMPAAMAATTAASPQKQMKEQPVTIAALPRPVEKKALKTWPKMADMTPLAWKLGNGDYRIVVHPTNAQSKSMVIAPDGMIQKG